MAVIAKSPSQRTVKHKIFLFDLDDTLLDYQASEQFAFMQVMQEVGGMVHPPGLFAQYQAHNFALWQQFEAGTISADFLGTERFRRTFQAAGLELDHERASHLYVESFAGTAILIDGAREVCEALSGLGKVGVMTNGVHAVQNSRLAASGLLDHLSFVSTSQACGFAKPDIRFFEHTARMAQSSDKSEIVLIGDRLEADILGAHRYGIESCWFNPGRLANRSAVAPTYEVNSLRDLLQVLEEG